MAIRVNNIILDIDEDIKLLRKKAAKRLKVNDKDIKSFRIVKESIDARKRNNIKFNYSVEVECENEFKVVERANNKDIKIEKESITEEFIFGNKVMKERPIVIGMGPAGMFAALKLAENGYKPIVIERGEKVENRTNAVEKFWQTGQLNLNSNVQFGEGGAGTFSDGKLTTRIKDNRCNFVLNEFVKAGAPEEILYMGKPHIGTDILKDVVKNIREKIKQLGGEVKFNSKLEDIKIKENKLVGIVVNGEEIPCKTLVLALGHSARDTYEMLFERGIFMTTKPFAIGVRIEHSQRFIDENQYGKYADHP
ncbi:MAG: NAD(P)/FAD-dependent oxidoreductase, partial [Clostridium sp.]|nr:NAD(P)/FAD-dependent oxidoreductase [Clostridium sp.]